jgi:hypothetical protein
VGLLRWTATPWQARIRAERDGYPTPMRFIRFVQARRHPESGVEDGLFGLAYELRDSPQIAAEDRAMLAARSSCCRIPRRRWGFHDFDQYERLLTAARKRDAQAYLMVLLGGRCRLAARRDHRARVARRRVERTPADRAAIRMARARDGAEGRTVTAVADDAAPHGMMTGARKLERATGIEPV